MNDDDTKRTEDVVEVQHETTVTALYPDGPPQQELLPEEVLAQASEAVKARWLAIFIQLSNSRRYTHFVENNFTIGDRIDHEAQTIETLVIEKPTAVGPPLTANQLWQIRKAIQFSGASRPDPLFRDIMKVLGQEPPEIIASASEADIKRALAEHEAKKKLDA